MESSKPGHGFAIGALSKERWVGTPEPQAAACGTEGQVDKSLKKLAIRRLGRRVIPGAIAGICNGETALAKSTTVRIIIS